MSGSVNKVILVGRLGRDPEIRNTQAGAKIVNMTVATSEKWNDRQSGEKKERTEWNRVVIFNEHLSGVAERFLKKGSNVYIEGELRTRKWTDQSGQEKYTTEVVIDRFRGALTLLDSKADSERSQSSQGGNNSYSTQGSSYGGQSHGGYGSGNNSGRNWDAPPRSNDLDSEIPF